MVIFGLPTDLLNMIGRLYSIPAITEPVQNEAGLRVKSRVAFGSAERDISITNCDSSAYGHESPVSQSPF